MIGEENGDLAEGIQLQIIKNKSIRLLIIILMLLILGVLLLPENDTDQQSGIIEPIDNHSLQFPDFLRSYSNVKG